MPDSWALRSLKAVWPTSHTRSPAKTEHSGVTNESEKRLILCGYAHKVFAMNYPQAKARADILKALAHPVRVLIVNALTAGDRCVCELNRLADIDQSNISRHLAVLKKAGVVTDRREGMKVFYHLQTPCILRAFECAVEVVRAEAKRWNGLVSRQDAKGD